MRARSSVFGRVCGVLSALLSAALLRVVIAVAFLFYLVPEVGQLRAVLDQIGAALEP